MAKTKDLIELKIGLSLEELVEAINELGAEDKEFLIENLLAATSPEYLDSIRAAREEYRQGKTLSHEELFEER